MPDASEVLVTDFRPIAAPTKNLQFLPYQLDRHQGHMLRLSPQRDTPAVLPSPVAGWHEIHLGFMGASGLQLRLSGDPSFCAKLKGHIAYFGVSCNGRAVQRFLQAAIRILFKWLNRRSQRKSFTWTQFVRFMQAHPLPKVWRG